MLTIEMHDRFLKKFIYRYPSGLKDIIYIYIRCE